MLSSLKKTLRPYLQETFLWDIRDKRRQLAEVPPWEHAGRPVPPPEIVKRVTLADYAKAFAIDTLIETGTFLGGALSALKHQFKNLYSIELSQDLAARARLRFQSFPHIRILQGDSAAVLPELLTTISEPCLFWLDGHYSSGITAQGDLDTPILQELRTILDHTCKNHVVLIDDARLFDGTNDYPTIDTIRRLYLAERPEYQLSVAHDIIRIHPPREVKTTY